MHGHHKHLASLPFFKGQDNETEYLFAQRNVCVRLPLKDSRHARHSPAAGEKFEMGSLVWREDGRV